MYITSTLKISSKSIQSSLRNRPDKKWEKNNKNNNKKPYNNYKVFRLKRKTLKNLKTTTTKFHKDEMNLFDKSISQI